MMRIRRRTRLATWFALVVMLFTAIAPTVSHALAAGTRVQGWTEVCTSQGTRWVRVEASMVRPDAASLPTPADTLATHFESCPFCVGSQHGMAPPLALLALPFARVSRDALPVHVGLPAPAAQPRCGAQPRAPPSFS
jgi:hypothetical protein